MPREKPASTPIMIPEENHKRPDPLFKRRMTKAALAAGLKQGPTELVILQTTNADMLLLIPNPLE